MSLSSLIELHPSDVDVNKNLVKILTQRDKGMDPNFRLKIKCKERYKCNQRIDLINKELDDREIPVWQDPNYDPRPFIRANQMLCWHITHCKTCSEHTYDPQGRNYS